MNQSGPISNEQVREDLVRLKESNEYQRQELNSLIKSLKDLGHQTAAIQVLLEKRSTEEGSAQFLLAEFDWLGDIWQQTDSRVTDTIRFYVAVAALIPTALLFFSQQFSDSNDLIMFSLPIALGLFVMGLIVVQQTRFVGWKSVIYRKTIRQINSVALLSAVKNVLRGELWRGQETGHSTNHQNK